MLSEEYPGFTGGVRVSAKSRIIQLNISTDDVAVMSGHPIQSQPDRSSSQDFRDKFNIRMKLLLLMACMLLLTSGLCFGRTDDREKPLNIEADTAEINDSTGISVYTGDVVITQGTTILKGDIVTVTAPGQDIEKVVSVGKPSTYQETGDDGKEVHAEALQMEFIKPENRIILLQKARIEQAGKTFASERIVYHTLDRRVDAGDKQNRVKMTIIPEKKESKDAGSKNAPQ